MAHFVSMDMLLKVQTLQFQLLLRFRTIDRWTRSLPWGAAVPVVAFVVPPTVPPAATVRRLDEDRDDEVGGDGRFPELGDGPNVPREGVVRDGSVVVECSAKTVALSGTGMLLPGWREVSATWIVAREEDSLPFATFGVAEVPGDPDERESFSLSLPFIVAFPFESATFAS
jgi:hypothetical protein